MRMNHMLKLRMNHMLKKTRTHERHWLQTCGNLIFKNCFSRSPLNRELLLERK
jgi:hypothetical protein